jgi:imidazoleglycerol-phosphate dehydratase
MRKAEIKRETKETKINLVLDLDGEGNLKGNIPLPYFKHLLETLIFYASFNLDIYGEGDIDVDPHHLIEDIGLTLGMALRSALSSNFQRFSHQIIPMDDALVMVALDISGRPFLGWHDEKNILDKSRLIIKEFIRAFVNEAKITLHINIISGENYHHVEEAIFKALGLALRYACSINEKTLSTKGKIL